MAIEQERWYHHKEEHEIHDLPKQQPKTKSSVQKNIFNGEKFLIRIIYSSLSFFSHQ